MRFSSDWQEYQLLDCSGGERLERWGNVTLIRPDPQVVWQTPKTHPLWRKADAVYWDWVSEKIRTAGRPVKVLNLFGYTGAATVSALKAGAQVVHVDASKGMVQWAKENALSSEVADRPVRWIVDDCVKFVQREIRRGNRYDILIMDPPSYGRGPGGEVWKLENEIYRFAELCSQVLSDSPIAVLINSYTAGLSPAVMQYILGALIVPKFGGSVKSEEIGLPVQASGLLLPCGATAIWTKDNA